MKIYTYFCVYLECTWLNICYICTLKMEAIRSFDTSGLKRDSCQVIRSYSFSLSISQKFPIHI
jgi:hypothetical protein